MDVFITGVSSGIGRELAKFLIKEGHVVWGVARRREELEKLSSEIKSGNFFYNVCNVSDKAAVRQVVSEMRRKNFLPDAVVLNAAAFKEDTRPEFSETIFEEVFKTNVFGATTLVEEFIGDFLKRKSGQFLAISSVSAFRPDFMRVSYSSSKTALAMAFRGLALHYRGERIFFKIIYFGPVATPMSVHVKRDDSGNIISQKFFVAGPEDAAMFIAGALKSKKTEYYFPFFSTALFRLINFLPDSIFVLISKALKN